MSVEQEVIDIVVEQLGVDKSAVNAGTSFAEDLNADSLDQMELIMTLEEHFGTVIEEEQAAKLMTVGDVIKFVEENKS